MRLARAAAALLASGLATPALATGGYECRPVSGSGPMLALVIGHDAGSAIVGARLASGRTVRSTYDPDAPLRIGQGWIDGQHLWLDLTDAAAMRYEARLRATFQPRLRGRPATGTLVAGGRNWRVRCTEA
jgi:hypothetical protein